MHLPGSLKCVIVPCLADFIILTVCMCVTPALQVICHRFHPLPWPVARVDLSLTLSVAGLMGDTGLHGITTAISMVLCISNSGALQSSVEPLAKGPATALPSAPTSCIVMGSATSSLISLTTRGIVTGLTIQLPGMNLIESVAFMCFLGEPTHFTGNPVGR